MTTHCHHIGCARPADIKVGDLLLLCAYHYNQRTQERAS